MLQQTQVDRVIPKWSAFLDAFPTPAACARAPLADVLRLWQGLGYPRRARNVHAAATIIAARGEFPSTLADLLQLPGVGQYTARAIRAFAFELPAAVVDTNIARVLARLSGRRLTAREAQDAADAALGDGRGFDAGEQPGQRRSDAAVTPDAGPAEFVWAWNQTMMDVGAMLCRPVPLCGRCPLQSDCAFHGEGEDPAIGSAGVSGRQSRFEGSDRQGRGRLMRAMAVGPVDAADLAGAMGWPDHPDRALRVAATVVADGLAESADGVFRLPGQRWPPANKHNRRRDETAASCSPKLSGE